MNSYHSNYKIQKTLKQTFFGKNFFHNSAELQPKNPISPFAKRAQGVLKKLFKTCPHENGEKKFLQGNTIKFYYKRKDQGYIFGIGDMSKGISIGDSIPIDAITERIPLFEILQAFLWVYQLASPPLMGGVRGG